MLSQLTNEQSKYLFVLVRLIRSKRCKRSISCLRNLYDILGRMPEALVIDVRGDNPTVTYVHKGTTPSDRPSIDELLEEVRLPS